jgi:hypothetical protein
MGEVEAGEAAFASRNTIEGDGTRIPATSNPIDVAEVTDRQSHHEQISLLSSIE